MLFIAHAEHWALGLVEAFPLIAVAAFAAWSTYAGRASGSLGTSSDADPSDRPSSVPSSSARASR
jgi:hypothetical protein